MKNTIVRCPNCGSKGIEISKHITVGDIVYCKNCDWDFEVSSLKPIELKALDNDEYEEE